MGSDVKVLEILLWDRTTLQPQLAHAASAAAEKPAQVCLWAAAEGPKAGACIVPRAPAHALHPGEGWSGLTMPVFNLQV